MSDSKADVSQLPIVEKKALHRLNVELKFSEANGVEEPLPRTT